MLKQRIITALALLAMLLPALFAGAPWPFAVLTLLVIGAAGWEWSRLNGGSQVPAMMFGLGLTVVCASTLASQGLQTSPSWVWWGMSLLWVLGGAQVLRGGSPAWLQVPRGLRLALGVLLLWSAWWAIALAKAMGINFLLSIFALVWTADIAAYFGGRRFGRRKLAPAISPGKSWEGVWTGMVAVLLLGLMWSQWIDQHVAVSAPSIFTRLLQLNGGPLGAVIAALAVVFLAGMSVVGDLFESLIKRAVGAKDSSALLPGHGGVLDRIDALLPVFPLALALNSLVP